MFKKLLMTVCLGVCVLNLGGCIFLAAGAAGVGTAKWLSDKVTQEVDKPAADVAQATKETLKDLKMSMDKETLAKDVTQILGRYSDGRQIWVDIRSLGKNNTQVDVRVGWISGEADARKVLEQIVKKAKGWF